MLTSFSLASMTSVLPSSLVKSNIKQHNLSLRSSNASLSLFEFPFTPFSCPLSVSSSTVLSTTIKYQKDQSSASSASFFFVNLHQSPCSFLSQAQPIRLQINNAKQQQSNPPIFGTSFFERRKIFHKDGFINLSRHSKDG